VQTANTSFKVVKINSSPSGTHLLNVVVSAEFLEAGSDVEHLTPQTSAVTAHTSLYPDVSLPSEEGRDHGVKAC